MVGPRSTKTRDATTEANPDPWASWTGPRLQAAQPMQVTRNIDGPTETRLAAQDAKLAGIEKQLTTITQMQEQHVQKTEERFQAAEHREKQHIQHVANTMEAIRQDMDRTLQNSFQKNTQVMEERLSELKQLLISNKRTADEMQD
jgi:hypothetical protein